MNMKLTKEQRHTAYIIMLAEAEQPNKYYHNEERKSFYSTEAGFCFMFFLLTLRDDLFESFENTLPELYKKRPIECDRFWFKMGNWGERKKLLKQCIEETA